MLVTHNVESDNTSTGGDILSQALGSKDPPGVVRGLGKFVMPSKYFHTPKQVKKEDKVTFDEDEKAKMTARIKELEEELKKQKNLTKCSNKDGSSEDIKEGDGEPVSSNEKVKCGIYSLYLMC